MDWDLTVHLAPWRWSPRQGALGMDVRREKCLSQERIAQLQLQSSLLALLRKGRKGRLAEKEHSERGASEVFQHISTKFFFFFIFSHLNRPQLLPENPQKTLKTVAEASNIGGHVAGKLHLFLFSEVWKETFHWIKRIRQSSWVKGFLWSLVFSCYLCIWYAFVFNNAHRGRETGWTHSPNRLRQCGQDVAGRVLSVQARNITLKHFGTRQ